MGSPAGLSGSFSSGMLFTARSYATTGNGLALAGRCGRSSHWSDEMAMTPRLEAAEYVADHRIRVRFADGREGEIDLAEELWGEVFEPLRDLSAFRRFRLDRELNTISWETGADLAPEYIYENAAAQPAAAADGPSARR